MTDELSPEDELRLNVLFNTELKAVRIDESTLTLWALTPQGEASVPLRPNTRADRYLKRVRELLSGHALGSPGGYPVHLTRWTRMGQTKDTYLAELLMLGEPEAVIAVACAPGLTDELARRAWWVAPTSENARRMLERECVVKGPMGRVLADHLVEHLPFEDDSRIVIETVRLVLQPGLIDEPARKRLWDKGTRQAAYRCGFLEALPRDLPEPLPARADHNTHAARLWSLAEQGNVLASLLLHVLDSAGQTFLHACEAVLERPSDHNVIVSLMNSIARYFAPARPAAPPSRDLAQIVADVESRVANAPASIAGLTELIHALPALRADAVALLALAQADEAVVTDILARTTAVGTVLRKKLQPITDIIRQNFAVLRAHKRG